MARLITYALDGYLQLTGPSVLLGHEEQIDPYSGSNHEHEHFYWLSQQISGQTDPSRNHGWTFRVCEAQEHSVSRLASISTAATMESDFMKVSYFPMDMKLCGSKLGYSLPGSQEVVEIPGKLGIIAIEVAVSPQGVNGMKFFFTNGKTSRWVGQRNGPGITRGLLRLSSLKQCCGLVASFDVCITFP